MSEILLRGHQLVKHYPVTAGFLQRTIGWVRAVDNISFNIEKGKTLSLVGESGAGKTTTARIILLLERPTSGSVLFEGKDICKLTESVLKHEYRPRVQAVQQNPWSSMNPRMKVRDIIAEPLIENTRLSKQQIKTRVQELLEQVGLIPEHADRYPHEFSGGQRQRIAVARALALRPSLIVLDEPVSALDVSIRAQIMNLLKDLQEKYNLSYLVIAHNLATVRYLSHTVAIMYLGQIVEYGDAEALFQNPLHPYTRALISASVLAVPEEEGKSTDQIILKGEMPSPINPPKGCRFHTRCPVAWDICSREEPEEKLIAQQRVKCHLYD
ncbi:MAG: dipeptide ABC transporter ATP-binding protein [Dehalococcoidales bacterium]|jgi:oligopeptide/dipeptide ABC transporter ATP-binding protein|nr:dipeptide ABC transporter ATP-binding protein [Dehalococcoidales bacterium]